VFLYRTADHGSQWQILPLPTNTLVEPLNSAGVHMTSPTVGWLVGTIQSPDSTVDTTSAWALYQTRDGGKTWTELAPLPAVFGTSDEPPARFDFINIKTGWAITYGGDLLYTADGAKSWTPLSVHLAPTF